MQLRALAPVFPTSHMRGAISYYKEFFGLKLDYLEGDMADAQYAVLKNESVELHLKRTHDFRSIGRQVAVFEVSGLNEVHDALVAKGARMIEPTSTNARGMRTLTVADPEGNAIIVVEVARS